MMEAEERADAPLLDIAITLMADREAQLEGTPNELALGWALFRDDLNGLTASELGALSEEKLIAVRSKFESFKQAMLEEYANEISELKDQYEKQVREAAKLDIEVFGLFRVESRVTENGLVPGQDLFSFRITNKTDKPIESITFVRGHRTFELTKITYRFPEALAPGAFAELTDMGIETIASPLTSTLGLPEVMNVRFSDDTWFPMEKMDRSLSDYLKDLRSYWEPREIELRDYRERLVGGNG